MTRQVKALTTKPDGMSWVPGTPGTEGENRLPQVVSRPRVCHGTSLPMKAQRQMHTYTSECSMKINPR